MTTYSYSFNDLTYEGSFDSREEAIAEAVGQDPDRPFWVGENEPPTQPEDWWSAEDWLEHVSCQDSYCGECAEDWEQSTKDQRAELESLVRPVLAAWLDRHKLRPDFWLVTNVQVYRAGGAPMEEVSHLEPKGA